MLGAGWLADVGRGGPCVEEGTVSENGLCFSDGAEATGMVAA